MHTFTRVLQVYLIEHALFFACGFNPFIGQIIMIRCEISPSLKVLLRC